MAINKHRSPDAAAVLIEKLDDRIYRALVAKLDGKVLACWCAPAWCHGELLAAYSSAYAERLAICQVEGVPEAEELAHQSGVAAIRANVERATREQKKSPLFA